MLGCTQYRLISLSTRLFKRNHYDTLGITPNATIADIKKAYYNLSMLYHPDKSDGSVDALDKFRTITEAYEILSNISTRRLYDRGVVCQTPIKETVRPKPKKQPVSVQPDGRTPIYNFEQWSRHHYGENILRRATAKKDYQSLINKKIQRENDKTVNVVLTAD